MRKPKKILIIAFLFCIFTYVCKIDSIPKNLIIYNGETLNIGDFWGLSLKIGEKDLSAVLASSNLGEEKSLSRIAELKLFNTVTVKKIDIDVINETTVIPGGQVSGLKLFTNGVLVVGMSEIKAIDNQKYKPYENSGIQEGDRIITINGENIIDTENLIQIVNNSKGENLKIEYIRGEEKNNANIKPVEYYDGTYKLGLWVRDSAAGIGTLSFYEPSTGNFAALGHRNNRCRYRRIGTNLKWRIFNNKDFVYNKRKKRKPWENSGNNRKPKNNRYNL